MVANPRNIDKDAPYFRMDSEQSSYNDLKATWTDTPSRVNTEFGDYNGMESPNKKRLSGYLTQKHIKRKESRNTQVCEQEQTYMQTAVLTFENLWRLEIDPSMKKPLAPESLATSVKTSFVSPKQKQKLLKKKDFNKTYMITQNHGESPNYAKVLKSKFLMRN